MKSLRECINEALDPNIAVGIGSFLGTVAGILAFVFGVERVSNKHPYATAKFWEGGTLKDILKICRDDHKVDKILKRLKADDDIQEFVRSGKSKGWRDLLASKLSEDEVQYIYRITRRSISHK